MDKLYIPGDLVIYVSLIKEPVAEICEVHETSYLIGFMGRNSARVTSKEIKPIPLTPAILEANGWNRLDNAYGLYAFDNPDEEWLELILEPDGWKAYCLNVGISDFFNSVHQLQHLLYGLGINHEMEV